MSDEHQYLQLLSDIIEHGHRRKTRNGYTLQLAGKQLTFDLKRGHIFPLITTKKMFFRGIFEEWKFFMDGKTDTKELEKVGVNIWKGNTSREFLNSVNSTVATYEEGDMGPMYFFQIYHFNAPYRGCRPEIGYSGQGLNQFEKVIHLLVNDRFSRRIVMTTFNPEQAEQGVLYPCHGLLIQFVVEQDDELTCIMTQRSADCFLGLPYNIASYSLLTYAVCAQVNSRLSVSLTNPPLIPGKLVICLGDCHIYESHISAVKEQLTRQPFPFPSICFVNKQKKQTDLQENRAQENRAQENRTQENRAQENRTQENRTQENRTQENRTQENRTQENRAQENRAQEIIRDELKDDDATNDNATNDDATNDDAKIKEKDTNIFNPNNITWNNVNLCDYQYHPSIKASMVA